MSQGFESMSFIGELTKYWLLGQRKAANKGCIVKSAALWGFTMLGNFGIQCRTRASELSHPRGEGAGIFIYQLPSIID